ncbi:MAG: hypothetical protein PUC07_06240 [Solobacterium sp.]|nr:hypothetical protein [Solobacterium sp.]
MGILQSMKVRGFLMIDALLCVFISCLISLLCYSLFFLNSSYLVSYDEYQEEINGEYELIFQNLGECEECVIQDLFPLEP